MNLTCYRLHEHAPALIPARAKRDWMEAIASRAPHRCIPLAMANSTGWELICPFGITASWNGGAAARDLLIEADAPAGTPEQFVESAFGHGVLTFRPGYLFRTDPEWAIWCRGLPNSRKDGIVALEGLVETDWLPFTFSMNWRFTRPGTVRFEKGEAFCFILPLPHMQIEAIEPKVVPLAANPELQAEHDAWAAARRKNTRRNAQAASPRPESASGRRSISTAGRRAARWRRRMAEPKEAAPAPPPRAASAPRREPDKAAATAPAPAPAPDRTAQNIIWIASYPKSGNTWVRTFLHNLLRELSGQTEGAQDINRLHERTAWETAAPRFEQILGKPITEASEAEIARARPEVQRRLAAGRRAPFLVKTHLCLGNDHRYPTINLDATLAAIYIVRSPLDVAISYAHHSDRSLDSIILHMATPGLKTKGQDRRAYEVMGSWSQHVASWMGMTGRPVHLMRYEDLLQARR
jgi:hypothetical protein